MLDFNSILGHKSIKDHLQKAIAEGHPNHAYIFNGEEGSGRKTMADTFAAALCCQSDSSDKPCGKCMACMQAASKTHPDIIRITHEKSRIGVDDIRNSLLGDITIKPFSSNYKIYIIDEAERMTEQAQNALLKTLEEPPAYAVIILITTNTGAFLQTIMSRCVTLQFKPLETRVISDYLMENEKLPDYFAKLCAAFSGGSIGQALKFAKNEDFEQIKNECLYYLRNIDSLSIDVVNDMVDTLGKRKADVKVYLDLMHLWFRDILMFKATQDANRLVFLDELMVIKRQASKYGFEALGTILDGFYTVQDRLNANVNFDIAIQLLLLKMREH
ncbi:MAG: DNA polymerase III subunit delta' [Lachnospiraceae bacterium]|nr:DNA polymerase III subunit delta' [Lachnospiraceae bacterium]